MAHTKLRNSENGVDRGGSRMIIRFYFTLEIWGLERHLSSIITRIILPRGKKESRDDSSLVMHRFYFEFPGRKERSVTSKYAETGC